jgi:hypothetical protein
MAGGWLSSAPQVLGLPLAPGFRVGVDFLKEIFYLKHSLGAVTSEREEALGLFAIITIAQALSIVMVSRSSSFSPCLLPAIFYDDRLK